jgi:hypothetical protein
MATLLETEDEAVNSLTREEATLSLDVAAAGWDRTSRSREDSLCGGRNLPLMGHSSGQITKVSV